MSLFASIVKIGFSGISDSVNSSLIEIGKKDKVNFLHFQHERRRLPHNL